MNANNPVATALDSPPPGLLTADRDTLDELIAETYDRLRRLASQMLRDYPCVGRWEETDDVWQEAAMRLHAALITSTPDSRRHFHRLAALQIRRTLIDLARRFDGPNGLAANHDTVSAPVSSVRRRDAHAPVAAETDDPVRLADWAEFHALIDGLPEPEREMFDLLWYSGLTQTEAAGHLEIDVRSVKRRWRAARLLLQERRSGVAPGR